MAERHVAGLGPVLESMRELVVWPVLYAEEAATLGLQWPRGLLLHGPPGTGKTLLVNAVAEECGAHLHTVSASSIFGAYAGESERRLRDVFAAAAADAARGAPAVIFIDEIDALCPRRDARRQQEARVVAQLLTLMDGIGRPPPPPPGGAGPGAPGRPGRVLVIAATNRPNAIDPALRRPGRFDREVAVTVPTSEGRAEILEVHARLLPLGADVDLRAVAAQCHGYVGADLAALCREAALLAMQQRHVSADGTDSGTGGGAVGAAHFAAAMKRVGPSIVRGAAAEVPPVTWDDIGGLHDVKRRLQQAVEWPLRHAGAFARMGLAPARGVLLHGPPGCSKTTLAKAAAHAARATLFSLSGAELFSMYVGEGEALLRDTFARARLAAPSIVFFDEADAVAASRAAPHGGGGAAGGGGGRLLAGLLTEMDGLEQSRGVLVLAATNRATAIDPALLRPGRFDLVLFVAPPDEEGRLEALRVHTRGMALAPDVDLAALAAAAPLFTGAELAGVCREAAMGALREDLRAAAVGGRHFGAALAAARPSLSPLSLASYAAALGPRVRGS